MKLNYKPALKRSGKNANQVAAEMGVTRNSFYSIVNGNPTITSIQKIADCLGCEMVELIPHHRHMYDVTGKYIGVLV